MKIVIFGSNGQIGYEVANGLKKQEYDLLLPNRLQVELSKPNELSKYLEKEMPSVIINATGYNAVDRAETENEMAMQINANAVREIAKHATQLGAFLIHYSTDYVFDGTKNSPYNEDDHPSPVNFYGKSKLAGEEYIYHFSRNFIIIRTSWVFGIRRNNFLNSILELSRKKTEIYVAKDQIGCPTWCKDIAKTTAAILEKYLNSNDKNLLNGIYHYSNLGETSRFDWANIIVRDLIDNKKPKIIPVSTSETKTIASRPLYSVLNKEKIQSVFKISIPRWEESFAKMVHEYRLSQSTK